MSFPMLQIFSLKLLVFLPAPIQEDGPDSFNRANGFLNSFFNGLGGIGMWVFFLVVAMGAVLWLYIDSRKSKLPVTLQPGDEIRIGDRSNIRLFYRCGHG
jgi:hypothetical protein